MKTNSKGLDLHIHSTASDGVLSPRELIVRGIEYNLDGIALTDHDSINGLPEFMCMQVPDWFHCIPGIEITVDYRGIRAHLLGYYLSDTKGAITALIKKQKKLSGQRVSEILAKLRNEGMNFRMSSFQHGTKISISLIADLIVREGYSESIEDAKTKYLQEGGLAYVEKKRIKIGDAIHTLLTDKAIPVLAHPLTLNLPDLRTALEELSGIGLLGVEAYYDYSHHKVEGNLDIVEEIGQELNLILTGGTDFHSDETSPPLGSITASIDVIKQLTKARK